MAAFAAGTASPEGSEKQDCPFAQIARHDVDGNAWALAFSPDDARLASATIEGSLWLEVPASRCAVRVHQWAFCSIRSLEFSPDGRVLAVAGQGPGVRFYDGDSGAELAGIEIGEQAKMIAFSPDGTTLAVGGFDGKTTLWDWVGRRRLSSLLGHHGGVNALAFSGDGRRLATGGSDGKVIVWDTARRRKLRSSDVDQSPAPVVALKFSPDGRLLAGVGAQAPVVRL